MATLRISHVRVMAALTLVWAVLIGLSVLQDVLFLSGNLGDKLYLLDVDHEVSFYTWMSSTNLLFAALILAFVSIQLFAEKNPLRFHWLLLSLIFAGLSCDEFVQIHEKISGAISAYFPTSGYLLFAWVIPAGIVGILGFLAYIPFIRSFTPRLQMQLVLSAVIFIGGAVFLEAITAHLVWDEALDQHISWTTISREYWSYRMVANLEEAMEGGGVLLFIDAIWRYQKNLASTVALVLG